MLLVLKFLAFLSVPLTEIPFLKFYLFSYFTFYFILFVLMLVDSWVFFHIQRVQFDTIFAHIRGGPCDCVTKLELTCPSSFCSCYTFIKSRMFTLF